jgi:hypothetical protein
MRIERRILLGRMETGTGGWDDPANKAYWRRQMGRRAMSDVRPSLTTRCLGGLLQGREARRALGGGEQPIYYTYGT